MLRRTSAVVAVAMAIFGCGSSDEFTAGDDGPGEQVGTAQQAVTWNPGATLLAQHNDWHTRPCSTNGQPLSGQVGVGRRCSRPGEDFLIWHRSYIERLRDAYEAQGLTHNIDPWLAPPSEITSHPNWTASHQAAVAAMSTLINPRTGLRFASLDEFGSFVEGAFHGTLHTISAQIWGGTDPNVGNFMSPDSTLFFKIHGLIDLYMERFLKGDANWDGKSDLVVRNSSNGVVQFWYMNDGAVGTRNDVSPASPVDGCNWYIGATPDINFDGHMDLVWHGPGCSATSVWFMNGRTRVGTASLPAVDNAWRLFGHADFNRDRRPDLAWVNTSTRDVSVWTMNGTTRTGAISYDIPAGWQPYLVGDLTSNGPPDFVYRSTNSGNKTFAVQYTLLNGQLGGLFSISGLSGDPYAWPAAIGHYRTTATVGDIMFAQSPPANVPMNRWLHNLSSVNMGYPTYASATNVESLGWSISIQGPR